jgi:hypothetical protein
MPRIGITLNYSDRNEPGFSAENENLDFCRVCWPHKAKKIVAGYAGVSEEARKAAFQEMSANPEGEEHPPYDDCDYSCECCGKLLTNKDD